MKDYKRLTKRNNDGTVSIDKNQFNDKIKKDEEKEQKSENATEWASNFIKRLARAGENAMVCCERLAELEDKIERGTLVELPRMVRRVDMASGCEDYLVQWENESGKIKNRIYLTEKSAKAKLRELQGVKDEDK